MIDPNTLTKKELVQFAESLFDETNTLPSNWIKALIAALTSK